MAIRSQFVRPRNFAGWLVGWEMALRSSNRKRNAWVVELLGLLRAGQPGAEFKDFAMPLGDEDVIEKRVNSAFIGTDLETRLGRRGISTLVLAGLTTDHCVSTTARMAGNLGFDTHVVGDATAAFDRVGPDGRRHGAEEVHALALASLHGEFATVLDTETVLRLLPEPRSRAPGGAAGGGPSWQPTGVPGEPAEAFDPHPE